MPEPIGFDLGTKEIRIPLIAKQEGREYRLIHVLREPTMEEWIAFQKESIGITFKGRKIDWKDTTIESRVKLYDKIALSCEGYVENGQPLDTSGDGWKAKIPVLHKSLVIAELGSVLVEEEFEKNLESTSQAF